MKTKKFFSILSMVLFSVALSYNVYAACGVSSNGESNTGHCRENSGGQDECYASGSGPACSHTVIIKGPTVEE